MSRWSRGGGVAPPGRLRAALLPPPFGRALAWRVALVWFVIHFGLGIAMYLGGGAGYAAFVLGVPQLLWLWGFVSAAVLIDIRTRREHVILANLAVPGRLVAVLVVGECAVLDAVAQLVVLGGSGGLRPGG